MPREKNKAARIIVPLVAFAAGIAVVLGVLTSGQPKNQNPPAAAEQPGEQAAAVEQTPERAPAETSGETPAAEPNDGEPAGEPATSPAGQSDTAPIESTTREDAATQRATVQFIPGLRARPIDPELDAPFRFIGGGDPDTEYELRIDFTPLGAGIEGITLTHEYTSVGERYRALRLDEPGERYVLQQRRFSERSRYTVASLAAHTLEINGQAVGVFSGDGAPIWRQTDASDASATFETIIENGDGEPVVRIVKSYSIRTGFYEVRLEQRVENLTDIPLDIRLYQYGPVDLPADDEGYGGDKRRVRFGTLRPRSEDPQQRFVESSKDPVSRNALIKKIKKNGAQRIWPTEEATENNLSLAWAALSNRYFAFAVHAPISIEAAQSGAQLDRVFRDAETIWGTLLWADTPEETLVLELHSPTFRIDPGQSADLSLGAYAGPKWAEPLRDDPVTSAVGLAELVIFNFGGPCAFCTFQPLAKLLLWFLDTLHDHVVFDWAVAIMILVFCVRLILHPVTKKSQISLQRFSKQMQALAPKQKKLQEKYKDDPKRLQQEMAQLMREEGVNFTGALGCLPMFLQTPVWIALYAMLFFAYELRHEAAFYGVFQSFTGGAWTFLGDLSAPDAFIDFGTGLFSIPLMGEISSFNILPFLLGAVFFVQQKYLTPPPSAAMTPEQQSQQKMIRVMMVVMFPVIMYNAPSGLALYFVTNSSLGILESRHIRAHIDQMDLQPKPKPAARKKVANTASPFAKQRPDAPKYKSRNKKR